MSMLEVKSLSVRYGELTIINNISFAVNRGQWLMLAGPNGAGKSTIVNAISRGAEYSGSVTFEGVSITKRKPGELAKDIGVLTQTHFVNCEFSVEDVVRLGRYSYSKGIFSASDPMQQKHVDAALEITGMLPYRKQSILTLSGGELQRAFLAQLFAQDPKLLILDEPANHLDLVYQKQIFDLIKNWICEGNRAVISVVHDLSLARAYGTNALLISNGAAVEQGRVNEVFTRQNLNAAYGIDVYDWMRSLFQLWDQSAVTHDAVKEY